LVHRDQANHIFCEQTVLQNLARDKPVINVTTEYEPDKVWQSLREKGAGSIEPNLLSFVDAYNETVGFWVSDRHDTVPADCESFQYEHDHIKVAGKNREKNILLVFDSLTSPYILSGSDVVRFMRLTRARTVCW
jgi:hypothetical protein